MEFIVYGPPKGKARPRYSGRSKSMYTPKDTAEYEIEIAEAFLEAGGKKLEEDEYVSISLKAYYAIPNSRPKKVKREMELGFLRPSVKPDLDNVVKIFMDGLNGIAYVDDKQVISIRASKYYAEHPCVVCTVKEVKL